MALTGFASSSALNKLQRPALPLASRPAPLAVTQRSVRSRAQNERQGNQVVTKDEVINPDQSKVENIEPGNISNENAEARADIGKTRPPSFTEAQAFDGPAPETINGRLCMLAVTSALAAEFVSGVGIKQQVAEQPLGVLASFVIISLASYIPIARGFTRKEPFANGIFTPKAENWNGRAAMVGFTGILITEALSGKIIPAFYGLPHGGF
ncbi:hypothetical protein WJX73_004832 [Symbiochloris irregularis]|uniref:Uncharacterized protein n=1 Tax=Symbiochloris irregularis TaxID=706552 RepID=A0AAW1PIK9_9CHLO